MRSGYRDGLDMRDLAMYRGRVASATRGRRGQQFFRDALAALDAMPVKRLIDGTIREHGEVCALGAVLQHRSADGIDQIDAEDHARLGTALDIAPCLAAEVEHVNDECGPWSRDETPEQRWARVRKWVVAQISEAE